MNELFFALIRVALGTQMCLPHTPSPEEWKELYRMAKKQSLLGICFAGVQKLQSQQQCPPEEVYDRWMAVSATIQMRNKVVSAAVSKVKKHFDEEGFDMVLLKGQGNLCNYPESIRMLRNSGDIDAWIIPRGYESLSLKEQMRNDEIVLKHFWKKDPNIRHCYIHIHEALFEDIDVEVHFRPSYINAPWRNIKFQKWMAKEAPKQLVHIVKIPLSQDGYVAVPTQDFNIVYQLSHLYRHIFDDGLGLRQIMDYYFVLTEQKEYSEETINLIRKFGLYKFCRSLMYVMQIVCGLKKENMPVLPDIEGGDFLLNEIMISGNFGHYDERERVCKNENGVQRLIRRQVRNMRFFSYYAEEVMCVPLYRVYQEYWRIKMNIKCK